MNDLIDENKNKASNLCKSCGLCCTGHLFIWVKLRPAELDPAEALGMTVFRSDPTQRGFSQPCPLWDGCCTIHDSHNYPRACRAYNCKLLKEVLADTTKLPDALEFVEQAKAMIHELKAYLPTSTNHNFRECLVAQIEHPENYIGSRDTYLEFRIKAGRLLDFYARYFGVTDLLENPDNK